jgi:glyoxylase-like metal-dependent hydrolase (beta-lactamase superfamily II)
MATIRDLAEEHWQGRGELVHAHHPVQPVHVHHDDGSVSTASEEIEDGLLTLKSIASVNALDTGDGLVMLDTGGAFDRRTVYDAVRGWRPDAPVRAAVYSHHHVDHVLGTALFDAEAADNGWERPVVYAHEDLPAHFRRYEQTGGWNTAINRRQFAIDVPHFSWPSEYRDPDVTYARHLTFNRGELTFELHHARGETDDATWTWVRERKVLHPGDLFIWALPNAGNPQKVQRYLSDWGAALRQMAALRPEILLAGHGLPIFGADRIVMALTDTAELLESIESQTLAIMNQGKNLDTCLHEVAVPAHLADKPYLQAVYDHPQFLIRNVWRRYGGWWDGEPDNLLPAPRVQQAAEWVGLAGGVDAVLSRAEEVLAGGDARLACHLVEFAALAAPTNADVWSVRARVYAAHSATHTSSMARNLLRHASIASEQGKRDLAGDY